ncbi:MAG TPA: hypothetical protein DCQ31_10500 [Bacteroidales bacterium]|nr:hypothetical protein [Bacteroidales bacterium]
MKKSILAYVVFAIISANQIAAQDQTIKKDNFETKHSIGFGAGYSTGVGISYRYVPKRFGAQITFGLYVSEKQENYSNGFSLLYKLKSTNKSTLFLYQGNHVVINRYFGFGDPTGYTYMHSLGIGIEINLLRDIGFNIMSGFLRQSDGRGSKPNFGPTLDLGLYYKF